MASNLFDLVAKAKQFAKGNPSARSAASRLNRTMNEYVAGNRSKWSVEREIQDFEKNIAQQRLNQYGDTARNTPSSVKRQAQSIVSKLGKFGSLMQGLLGNRKAGYNRQELAAISNMMDITDLVEKSNSPIEFTTSVDAAMNSLEDHGWSIEDAMQTQSIAGAKIRGGRPASTKEPSGSEYQDALDKMQSGEQQAPRFSPLKRTPQSSNVYSFQFDYLTGTLYVRFQAPNINPLAVTNYTSQGGMKAMAGELGKTVMGKSGKAGALYAYYNVPIKTFRRIEKAGSAGKAVWNDLRERGSAYGHQFKYGLVESTMVPGEKGEMAHYVPRKATASGFRSRSVARPGLGRRQYVSSTLPQRMYPNRGRPDPPNRGR